MQYFLRAAVLFMALWLTACNPTFNWREVRPDTGVMVALFPCKPEQVARTVALAGQPVRLDMLSCDAGGATFAIGHAAINDPAQAGDILTQWRTVTLANLRAKVSTDEPFLPTGSLALPGSVRVAASGQRANGDAVQVHAAWFAQSTGSGIRLFQAVVYADKVNPEVSDTFFSALRLQ